MIEPKLGGDGAATGASFTPRADVPRSDVQAAIEYVRTLGATFSAFGRTLVDDVDASAARVTLGLVIGTNVQAYDAELAAIAGLTSVADGLPYFTGSGTASLTTLTTFGRSLVDDADAATARATLGLVIGANVQAFDAELATIAALTDPNADRLLFWDDSAGAYAHLTAGTNLTITGTTINAAGGTLGPELTAIDALTSVADGLPYFTGSGTAALTTLTTFGRSLIDDADAAASRATLGLSIGTDVQAYDADLAAIAALADPNADRLLFWDDSAGTYAHLIVGANLTVTGTTIAASSGGISRGPIIATLLRTNRL